jgi:outer membrane protein TolC
MRHRFKLRRSSLTPVLNSVTTNSPGSHPPDSTGETLTRQLAEQLALKNNPRISVAALLALAQKQVVRETRSALLPALNGNLTGVDAEEASRISAGTLSDSRLLYHAGAGVDFSQLITDFGRTRNLVASSSFQAKASQQQSEATREDIVLAADIAFYNALEAQATLQVAKSTVKGAPSGRRSGQCTNCEQAQVDARSEFRASESVAGQVARSRFAKSIRCCNGESQ